MRHDLRTTKHRSEATLRWSLTVVASPRGARKNVARREAADYSLWLRPAALGLEWDKWNRVEMKAVRNQPSSAHFRLNAVQYVETLCKITSGKPP